MVDNVLADCLPAVVLCGELDFGADAVGGSDEKRLRGQFVQSEKAAETAHVGEHVGREGRADGRLHQIDCAVAGFDVDAGGGVLSGRLADRVVRVWW